MSPCSGCSAPGGGGGGLHKQVMDGTARAVEQKQLMTDLKLDTHTHTNTHTHIHIHTHTHTHTHKDLLPTVIHLILKLMISLYSAALGDYLMYYYL